MLYVFTEQGVAMFSSAQHQRKKLALQ